MKLSVIIVNYNVKYFLTQCLRSTLEAQRRAEAAFGKNSCEIIVVDNASKDGSAAYIKEKFKTIHFIENQDNKGFSGANNQGIKAARGAFILLLNPDTIVPEDLFVRTLQFMDKHPDAGGLGVKMVNGQGEFLPESKRAFPTPAVSFYKIFGLSKLFPKSSKFGQYHLTYLSEDETHQVDVLSGACMFLRKETLQKIGLLDETFFMYGEDIDLSYRITKSGYKNYYYPYTQIIHYKGESTKKGSLNYVYMFYRAMNIFVKKHINKTGVRLYSFLIKCAIWIRALLSAFRRLAVATFLPLADALLFFLGFFLITPLWESYKFSGSTSVYPPEFMHYIVPGNILLWSFFIFIFKGYRKNAPPYRINKGILWGSLMALAAYSLLNESYRFSRALLLMGSFCAIFSANMLRYLLYLLSMKRFAPSYARTKNILILAPPDEFEKIKSVFMQSQKYHPTNYTFDSFEEKIAAGDIHEYITRNQLEELIISYSQYSYKDVILIFNALAADKIPEMKTFLPEEAVIIGYETLHLSEQENYMYPDAVIQKKLRIKRRNDLIFSFFLFLAAPVALLLTERKRYFFSNIFLVWKGERTWVGYRPLKNPDLYDLLPRIPAGILYPQMDKQVGEAECMKANFADIKNYDFLNELYTIFFYFRYLGNKIY